MFADDTVIVLSHTNINDIEKGINSDLELYSKWLCHNKLSINVDKTVFMIFNQRNKKNCDIKLRINDM